MTNAEMIDALTELGEELMGRDIAATLYIVGGAVMVLAHNSRDATMDGDGDFYPHDSVMEVAREIAIRRKLPKDWLSAAANGVIPVFKSPQWRPLYHFGTLDILAADDRTMLAMKIRASRGRRDEPDIALLLEQCDVTSVEQAFELCEEYFPEDPPPGRARLILEHLLSR